MKFSVFEMLSSIQKIFHSKKIPNPRLEAEILIRFVLQINQSGIYTKSNQILTEKEMEQLQTLVQKRIQGTPMAYLLEEKEFFSLPLKVNESVLIPRPETEFLVELALAELDFLQKQIFPKKNLTIIDVGTGSGAISLVLKTHLPSALVLAIDRSVLALQVAKQNAKRLQCSLSFLHADLLNSCANESAHLIVSNPPYIPTGDLPFLQKEVQNEPHLALDGGEDGLMLIRRLIHESYQVLFPKGVFIMEIGFGQFLEVERMMKETGFQQIQTHLDFANIPRIVYGRK